MRNEGIACGDDLFVATFGRIELSFALGCLLAVLCNVLCKTYKICS